MQYFGVFLHLWKYGVHSTYSYLAKKIAFAAVILLLFYRTVCDQNNKQEKSLVIADLQSVPMKINII